METNRSEAILSFTFKKLEEMLAETRRKPEPASSPGQKEQPESPAFRGCGLPAHLNAERS